MGYCYILEQNILSVGEWLQRSGIDTIKYHTIPRIPTKHNLTPQTRQQEYAIKELDWWP